MASSKTPTQSLVPAIPATEFAISYDSAFTAGGYAQGLAPQELKTLSHVNCSYLSGSRAPTLFELKQHAQSLAILIRRVSLSTTFGVIDNENYRKDVCAPRFDENEAFDWLNDLSAPYANDDEHHNRPLWALHNHVASESERHGAEHHCPLATCHESAKDDRKSPEPQPQVSYAHLTQHANQCLSILDHDLAGKGGIMALVPEVNSVGFQDFENTLVGQLLLREEKSAERILQLEYLYAQALDALTPAAFAPLQVRSVDKSRDSEQYEREAQRKFVLVNVTEDMERVIHGLFDEAERKHIGTEARASLNGVSGRSVDAAAHSPALIKLDMLSRLYRVKGAGSDSAIFLLPALKHHPGTRDTLALESTPRVVTVPEPHETVHRATKLEQMRRAERAHWQEERKKLTAQAGTVEPSEVMFT
ncbi:uncharacterized protein J7T54_001977 [Emericellopsis cladophorae]|uniref:Uncharacterized protein n=1 Tax=Emericellopsis cladophorae TaxID=2686198 RepID=A0A9P9XXW3_9HYPO|nr:uncharacterized protein J7T54_001977 [Emericellopsis cladophorae]KAI6779889.1 hypothetical protein J7T54_001977 [Emericellopsis cladophorae]